MEADLKGKERECYNQLLARQSYPISNMTPASRHRGMTMTVSSSIIPTVRPTPGPPVRAGAGTGSCIVSTRTPP